MWLTSRVGFRLAACLILAGAIQWGGLNPVRAENSAARRMLVSVAQPRETADSMLPRLEQIEKLLSGQTLNGEEGAAPQSAWSVQPTMQGSYADESSKERLFRKLFPREDSLRPGVASLNRFQERLTRLATLDRGVPAASRQGATVLDSWTGFSSAGSLVGDSRGLYNDFEIRVNISKFTLELVARTPDGQEKQLYTCKVGLGSAEYRTPSGSYYIARIFDDKPLWIPPQDRPWAWGQSPSHSVYGGHMMPFFSKVSIKSPNKDDDDAVTDLIAAPVKLVDAGMYRIHGTDSPWSVGSGQSHGCVRMKNNTVKILADNLKMYVGMADRGESANGKYVNLARPVKLTLFRER